MSTNLPVLSIVLLLATAVVPPLQAQQNKPAETTDTKQAPAKAPAEVKAAEAAAKAAQNAKQEEAEEDPDFIPTEEISEDLSVSFPIDI